MSEIKHFELVLSTGKKVVIRDMEIGDQEEAVSRIPEGKNQLAMASLAQQELLKLLIVKIDEQPVDKVKLTRLSNLFSHKEYNELLLGLEDVVGKPQKPQINFL